MVPAGTALDKARSLAERVARNGPLAVRNAKEAVVHSGWIAEEDARAIEARLTRQVISSADAREGLSAFREKREARFTGQ